jgi:Tol biopolymer transport system component
MPDVDVQIARGATREPRVRLRLCGVGLALGLGLLAAPASPAQTIPAAAPTAPATQAPAPRYESRLEIVDVRSGVRTVVHRADVRFEAPNWSRDGAHLLINQQGSLYRVPVEGGTPVKVDIGDVEGCNNDHGYSPDGDWLAISCRPSSSVYVVPSAGGAPRLLTPLSPSYWHGWSPDGRTLAYVGQRGGEFDIYTMAVTGGTETRLTTAKGLDDGPDYSPDGQWIYFNSVRSGTMRIWRMRPDGSDQQQVTFDAQYADWFPHPSPDGKWLVWVSFDAIVEGHPPYRPVVLRLLPLGDPTATPRVLFPLFGGQGTINVPSWSPDSTRFAFVSYQPLP